MSLWPNRDGVETSTGAGSAAGWVLASSKGVSSIFDSQAVQIELRIVSVDILAMYISASASSCLFDSPLVDLATKALIEFAISFSPREERRHKPLTATADFLFLLGGKGCGCFVSRFPPEHGGWFRAFLSSSSTEFG
jgi:hypothetical protein